MGKMNRLWSIFTDDMDTCIFTGSNIVERHHVFAGKARRKKCEKYGFIAPLRPDKHPNGVYFVRTEENLKIDNYLKQQCQIYFECHYGSREDFRKEFGKSYL